MSKGDGTAQSSGETQQTLYLTTYSCPQERCDPFTIAHEGPYVPADQSAPSTGISYCPNCTVAVHDEDIIEVREAETVSNPEVPPDER